MKKTKLRIASKGWNLVLENLLVRPGLTVNSLMKRVNARDYCLFIIRRGKGRMLAPEEDLHSLLYPKRRNELLAIRIPQGKDFPKFWGDEPRPVTQRRYRLRGKRI